MYVCLPAFRAKLSMHVLCIASKNFCMMSNARGSPCPWTIHHCAVYILYHMSKKFCSIFREYSLHNIRQNFLAYSSWSLAHICTVYMILIITAGFDYYAKSMFLCIMTFFAQSATILSLSPGKSIWTKLHGHTVAGHWHISVIHT